jgi:hypothetical protein
VISIPAIFRDLSQNHSRARFFPFVLRIISIILKIPTQEATLGAYFLSVVEVLRNTELEDAPLFRDIAQVFIDTKIEMLISRHCHQDHVTIIATVGQTFVLSEQFANYFSSLVLRWSVRRRNCSRVSKRPSRDYTRVWLRHSSVSDTRTV